MGARSGKDNFFTMQTTGPTLFHPAQHNIVWLEGGMQQGGEKDNYVNLPDGNNGVKMCVM
jgi:hypothetical protein